MLLGESLDDDHAADHHSHRTAIAELPGALRRESDRSRPAEGQGGIDPMLGQQQLAGACSIRRSRHDELDGFSLADMNHVGLEPSFSDRHPDGLNRGRDLGAPATSAADQQRRCLRGHDQTLKDNSRFHSRPRMQPASHGVRGRTSGALCPTCGTPAISWALARMQRGLLPLQRLGSYKFPGHLLYNSDLPRVLLIGLS
jgi:hypothetical protein